MTDNTKTGAHALTVGDLFCEVLGTHTVPMEAPEWPPDVFAIVATVLKRTGTYICVASHTGQWASPREAPPNFTDEDNEFYNQLRRIGRDGEVAHQWRRGLCERKTDPVPEDVRRWWSNVTTEPRLAVRADRLLAWSLAGTDGADDYVRDLLRLMVAADEACRGAGLLSLPPRGEGEGSIPYQKDSRFYLRCADNLFWKWWRTPSGPESGQSDDDYPLSSLCEAVHPTRAIVLPKIHVPQAGLTFNSMSRHLALCDIGNDVAPIWRWIPRTSRPEKSKDGINVLVIPYPFDMQPKWFGNTRDARTEKGYSGYFSYEAPRLNDRDFEQILAAIASVEARGEHLDAVVLPEMAITNTCFEELCRRYVKWAAIRPENLEEKAPPRDGLVLIAGVRQSEDGDGGTLEADLGTPGPKATNQVAISFQMAHLRVAPDKPQAKHHRWRIDDSQVRQYGLGYQLDPGRLWWEDIAIMNRRLYFWSMAEWLSMSVLVCEDLARQEPVAEVVRAVGPNLVIALLMDGPQLRDRWSARYATILADDPGCSVLTVTSLGMAKLSRPPDKPESRVIALWKDESGRAEEIELPEGGFGVLLWLTREKSEDCTADGRGPMAGPARLRLTGVHTVWNNQVGGDGDSMDSNSAALKRETPDARRENRSRNRTSDHLDVLPMLQPYQATALAMTLFAQPRSTNIVDSKTEANEWPDELKVFAEFVATLPEESTAREAKYGWKKIQTHELRDFVLYLHGALADDAVSTLDEHLKTAGQELREVFTLSAGNSTAMPVGD